MEKSESLKQTPTPNRPDEESCLNISLVPSQRAFEIDETPNKLEMGTPDQSTCPLENRYNPDASPIAPLI